METRYCYFCDETFETQKPIRWYDEKTDKVELCCYDCFNNDEVERHNDYTTTTQLITNTFTQCKAFETAKPF